MGEQRNLTEENVDELREQLDRMKEDNPDLEYMFYKQKSEGEYTEQPDQNMSNDKIFLKLEKIERLLNLIFDDHVLIDGQFKKISV